MSAYRDHATGALKNVNGVVWIPRVELNISVDFEGEGPDGDTHEALHHKAHEACFIANSVKTEVVVNLT